MYEKSILPFIRKIYSLFYEIMESIDPNHTTLYIND